MKERQVKPENKEVSLFLLSHEIGLRDRKHFKPLMRAWAAYIRDKVLIKDQVYSLGLLGTIKIIPSNVSTLKTKNHYVCMTQGIEAVIHNNHSGGWVFRTKWDRNGGIHTAKQRTIMARRLMNYRFRFVREIRRELYHLIKGGKTYV